MRTFWNLAYAATLVLASGTATANCETNVDRVEVHYINGMFNDLTGFTTNRHAVQTFMDRNFAGRLNYGVSGTHNPRVNVVVDAINVAKHKYQDAEATVRQAIMRFMNGDLTYANDTAQVKAVQDFLAEIAEAYTAMNSQEDTRQARANLVGLLDTCARVLLMTHSQGNFYANTLFNDLYSSYVFPNGYPLAQYPMLGNVQIATPVYEPGGAAGRIYPGAVEYITNNTDLVVLAVRARLGGAAPANYTDIPHLGDLSGHALRESYLERPGQAAVIAGHVERIVSWLTPYPMHRQVEASSSALQGFGYSGINRYLDIQFTSGAVYRYENVEESVAQALGAAPSQGGYFNEAIRDVYPFVRLE